MFPGEVGEIGAFSFYKRKLDRLSKCADWRLHDLRRTFASGLQDLDIEPSIIEACLNHSLPGVMGTYLRSSLERQKAAAWAAWADELAAYRRRTAGRVVSEDQGSKGFRTNAN